MQLLKKMKAGVVRVRDAAASRCGYYRDGEADELVDSLAQQTNEQADIIEALEASLGSYHRTLCQQADQYETIIASLLVSSGNQIQVDEAVLEAMREADFSLNEDHKGGVATFTVEVREAPVDDGEDAVDLEGKGKPVPEDTTELGTCSRGCGCERQAAR